MSNAEEAPATTSLTFLDMLTRPRRWTLPKQREIEDVQIESPPGRQPERIRVKFVLPSKTAGPYSMRPEVVQFRASFLNIPKRDRRCRVMDDVEEGGADRRTRPDFASRDIGPVACSVFCINDRLLMSCFQFLYGLENVPGAPVLLDGVQRRSGRREPFHIDGNERDVVGLCAERS